MKLDKGDRAKTPGASLYGLINVEQRPERSGGSQQGDGLGAGVLVSAKALRPGRGPPCLRSREDAGHMDARLSRAGWGEGVGNCAGPCVHGAGVAGKGCIPWTIVRTWILQSDVRSCSSFYLLLFF